MNETAIAWPSDIERFKNIKKINGIDVDYKDYQWIDMTDGKLIKIYYNILYRTLYCLDETFGFTNF